MKEKNEVFCVNGATSWNELLDMHNRFIAITQLKQRYSFVLDGILSLSQILQIVRMAEQRKDSFWQMLCTEIVDDYVRMNLPEKLLCRFYRLGVRYDDWCLRSAISCCRGIPKTLYGRILNDENLEVRRHFLFSHCHVKDYRIRRKFLETILDDVDKIKNKRYLSYVVSEVSGFLADEDWRVLTLALRIMKAAGKERFKFVHEISRCLFDKRNLIRHIAHECLDLLA